MRTLFLSFALLSLLACSPPTPEEKVAEKEAFEESLKFDDAHMLGNQTQWILRFDGDVTFPLDKALVKYIKEHPDRRVVSISPVFGRGEYNIGLGYWVVVEETAKSHDTI